VLHCDIIRGCATIKSFTLTCILLYYLTLPFYWQLMTTATILSIVFNFLTRGDHTYKAIWTLNIDRHSELWVKDGNDHDTFAVVVNMTEYIVGHILKAIIYYHLLLKICTCGTIRGCTTIKINHENMVICTWIVTYYTTIRIYATNQVNTVHSVKHTGAGNAGFLRPGHIRTLNW